MAPRPEVTRYVRNQSSRNGVKPKLIVVHSTEGWNIAGLKDLIGLGNWFDNPAAQASSHVANDAEGNDARYVRDERKAWTCAAYNSLSLNLEMVGKAAQGAWPDKQIQNTAEWMAYWSVKYGIPLTFSTSHGVCRHSDLGAAGGGHHDPGKGFPLEECIQRARKIVQAGGVDIRKEATWRKHLEIERSRLRSVLATRAKLRQRKLENSRRYALTTEQMKASRTRIKKLLGLLRRG